MPNKQHREPRPAARRATPQFEVLFDIARDLTASLAASDRYERLIAAMRRVIPADAIVLFRLDGEELVPLASHGLSEEARVRRYRRSHHPRLDIILRSSGPVRFPLESDLPDPFDGMLAADPGAHRHIHACLGCALSDEGVVIGALTADALEPHAFDDLDERFLGALGALAGAAVRTTALIERLEVTLARTGAVARELQEAAAQVSGGDILGQTAVVRRLLESVDLVARSDLPVLITGETGVGKELVARRIHGGSQRRDEPLIHVNCAALPETVAESELFGHVAGAFTGAIRDRAGKFEIADGGTLFLDEIGELPLSLQPKLLRALQEGEIQRVGSDRVHKVDVRIITATNRDLEQETTAGRFRADLYHRLAVFPIRVPALRERRPDIPLLAAHFLDAARRRLGLGPLRLSEEAKQRLQSAPWPGNVRELENVISRAVLRATAPRASEAAPGARAETGRSGAGGLRSARDVPIQIREEFLDLGPGREAAIDEAPAEQLAEGEALANEPASAAEASGSLRRRTTAFQRRAIEQAIENHRGNWAAAARDLGLHRSNLHHLAARLGMRKST